MYYVYILGTGFYFLPDLDANLKDFRIIVL